MKINEGKVGNQYFIVTNGSGKRQVEVVKILEFYKEAIDLQSYINGNPAGIYCVGMDYEIYENESEAMKYLGELNEKYTHVTKNTADDKAEIKSNPIEWLAIAFTDRSKETIKRPSIVEFKDGWLHVHRLADNGMKDMMSFPVHTIWEVFTTQDKNTFKRNSR